MITQGKFIVIDGPNAVGKSTVINLVVAILREKNKAVLHTKEPTPRFKRSNEETKHGDELAELITEDRRQHLVQDIEPALAKGVWVICDRYVCSSLVYRALDEIPFEITWSKNSSFRIPDINIVLTASIETIESRLSEKLSLTRFEREHTPQEELLLYKKAISFLTEKMFAMHEVQNDGRSPEETADEIVQNINSL